MIEKIDSIYIESVEVGRDYTERKASKTVPESMKQFKKIVQEIYQMVRMSDRISFPEYLYGSSDLLILSPYPLKFFMFTENTYYAKTDNKVFAQIVDGVTRKLTFTMEWVYGNATVAGNMDKFKAREEFSGFYLPSKQALYINDDVLLNKIYGMAF